MSKFQIGIVCIEKSTGVHLRNPVFNPPPFNKPPPDTKATVE